MEKHQYPFDDFLKEALKGHQLVPPEKAKKAFLEEASAIIPSRKGWYRWYYLPIILIFISAIIVVFYNQSIDQPSQSAYVATENISSATFNDSSNSTSTLITGNKLNTSGSSGTVENKTNTESEPLKIITDIPLNTNENPLESGAIISNESKINVMPPPSTHIDPVATDSLFSKTTASKLALDSLSKNETGIIDTIAPAGSPASNAASSTAIPENPITPKSTRADQTPYFTAGVCYLPEWMFNTLEDSKFVNNFGIEATFYRGFISIRTGAGISVSKGISENTVEYNSYLGSYNKLDSIDFTFNETTHDFIPNLYMSSEKVWDSIAALDSTSITKRYTYLQFPLILGFDFWQRGIFTIGVRVGTIMSVLLNSKQLTSEYNPGENQVIGINMLTPEQVSINWQAIGGINASVRLTEDFFLEIEPQAKYYYQSIYEKSDMTKKPWSVGVRAAVIYKF